MKIDLYTQSGDKKGQIEVNSKIFESPINDEAVRLALLRQQAHEREPLAHTKTRGEVALSTRKLYRQKGTGRARMGGASNPIRRGGGTAFGPRSNRNYGQRLTKKGRRLALFSLLSQKAASNNILALEKYEAKAPKTKDLAALFKKLPVGKSFLFVLDKKDMVLEKSSANLPNVKTILVNYLNPFDLLKYEKTLFMADALKKTEEVFL